MSPQIVGNQSITKSPLKSKLPPKSHIWKEPPMFSNALSRPIIFSLHSSLSSICGGAAKTCNKNRRAGTSICGSIRKGGSNLYRPSIIEFWAAPISRVSGEQQASGLPLGGVNTCHSCWRTAVGEMKLADEKNHKTKTSAKHSQALYSSVTCWYWSGKKHVWTSTANASLLGLNYFGRVQFSEIPVPTSNWKAPEASRGYI